MSAKPRFKVGDMVYTQIFFAGKLRIKRLEISFLVPKSEEWVVCARQRPNGGGIFGKIYRKKLSDLYATEEEAREAA